MVEYKPEKLAAVVRFHFPTFKKRAIIIPMFTIGLEPILTKVNQILSLTRLPIPPSEISFYL
jgi:hypothetical protein